MESAPRVRTAVIASFLFFCSGALGLGYELVWIREAARVVGASQIALSTVLTAFFVGIALGSAWIARHARSRRRSPLFVYGLFELGIGAFALSFPLLFRGLEGIYAAAYPLCASSALALFGLRFGLLFALFLPPTFLMGGTLPLLLDGLLAQDREIGSRASGLYGLNIAGAVAGVLGTSYFAIPSLGMTGASVAGGLANLAIGAAAVAAFRSHPVRAPDVGDDRVDPLLGALAFGSGLVALGYQVLWARYFSLLQFSSVYLTAILLAVFLAALAAGSLALAPLLRLGWHPLRIAGVAQCAAPVAALLCLTAWRLADYRIAVSREFIGAGQAVPSATLEIAHDFPKFWRFFNETADATFFAPLAQVALTLFLPVALLGVGLPAWIAAGASRRGQIRSAAGRLVFWNTLGCGAGSFLAGYALLPLLGLHGSFVALALGSTAIGGGALLRGSEGREGRRSWRVLVPPIASAATVILLMATRGDITRATLRERQLGRDPSRARLIASIEGPTTTAWVFDDDATLRIGSGAIQMGSVAKDAVNPQVIEGHLPALFYPGPGGPRDCLGICLGSGQSFGALLRYPVGRLEIVEISGEITSLAQHVLASHNNGLARDPRVTFHLDDGRHFVARAATASFDLISMESPPPISDGAHGLYTAEFYRDVRRVLRPGGVFMQFMPLYYLSPSDVRCVLRTLTEVFPDTFALKVSPGDFMLLAYPAPPRFPRAALEERIRIFEREWTDRGLPLARWSPEASSPIASLPGALSMIVTGPEDAARTDATYRLRDDRPLLGYGTGDRWLTRRYMGPALTFLSFTALPRTGFDRLRQLVDPPLSDEEVETLTSDRIASLRAFHVPHPRAIERKNLALELAESAGERADRALDLAQTYDAELDKESAFRYVEQALDAVAREPGAVRAEQLDAVRRIVRNRIAVYEHVCERWLERFDSRFAGSALLQAMRDELNAHRAREAETARGYLVP